MIVKHTPEGWEVIFQRSHALLAAKLFMHLRDGIWKEERFRTEALVSIAEHDNGQTDFRGSFHLTPQGTPLDYRQSGTVDTEQARRVTHQSRFKSRFITLMVAHHFHTLYKGLDGEDVKKLRKDLADITGQMKDSLGLDDARVHAFYLVMRWCDEFSLLLCQEDLRSGGHRTEIGELPEEGMVSAWKNERGEVMTDPWCFRDSSLSLDIDYFLTDKITFENDHELEEHLRQLQPQKRTFRLVSST